MRWEIIKKFSAKNKNCFRHAAKKRYLFLSDILELEWTSEHQRMLNDSGASISLLNPIGPEQGIKNSRFGLKINIEVNSLKDILHS